MTNKQNTDHCPNCGGIFPHIDFVCDYCGYVETDKVKQLNETNTKEISFDESMNVLQENLNALHDINKPTIQNGIVSVLRVIVAIHTFGLILIFWKKPKKRFNKKSYELLKKIILRNIQFLKISSAGSNQLMNRILVIENELERTELEVKNNLRTKRIVSLLVIAAYVALFFSNAVINPILHTNLYPYKTDVSGDLFDTLEIVGGPAEMQYIGGEDIHNLRLTVRFRTLHKWEIKDSMDLAVQLVITDSTGTPLSEFLPSELQRIHKNAILRELKYKANQTVSVEFFLTETQELDTIPSNLTHFKIHTEITQKEY